LSTSASVFNRIEKLNKTIQTRPLHQPPAPLHSPKYQTLAISLSQTLTRVVALHAEHVTRASPHARAREEEEHDDTTTARVLAGLGIYSSAALEGGFGGGGCDTTVVAGRVGGGTTRQGGGKQRLGGAGDSIITVELHQRPMFRRGWEMGGVAQGDGSHRPPVEGRWGGGEDEDTATGTLSCD
jgi:hypothetical protein